MSVHWSGPIIRVLSGGVMMPEMCQYQETTETFCPVDYAEMLNPNNKWDGWADINRVNINGFDITFHESSLHLQPDLAANLTHFSLANTAVC